MRPEGCHWNVNRRSNRCHLNLDCRLAKLLDGSCSHGAAVAHKGGGLAVPLGVNPVDGVFQHRRGAVVVFRRDEHKTIRRRDVAGPLLNYVVFVGRSARHSWRQGLVEERHRELAEVEEPSFNTFSLMQLLKNPLSRLSENRPWRVLPMITEIVILSFRFVTIELLLSADEAD